ncbi:MAG: TolC family protein [Gemmatimonadetes bacterium]|nr:TolC family protein [Gemmatimonadota bacterium]
MARVARYSCTRFLAAALALASLATVPAAAQTPAGLSLEDAIALAKRHNPTFQAHKNDEGVADWNVRSAYGALLPGAALNSALQYQGSGEQRFGSLSTGDFGFGSLPSYYLSWYSAGLNLDVSGTKLFAPGQAKLQRDATRAQIASAAANLEYVVSQHYLNVLRADGGERLAVQQLERARQNLRLAEARLAVGAATTLEVKQAEVAVGRAEVALLQARNAVGTARLRLVQQLGIEFQDSLRLTTAFQVFEPSWTGAELYERALQANPGLAALRASARAADYGVRMARSTYFPSLSLQAGLSGFTRQANRTDYLIGQAQAAATGRIQQCQALNEIFRRLSDPLPLQDCTEFQLTDTQRRAVLAENDRFPFDFTRQPGVLTLVISLPVFTGFSRQRDVEAAKAAQDDARHRSRELELQLRADIAAGLAAVRTAHESARLEERNQVVANEQLRLAQERYRLGAASFLDLVEAETLKATADKAQLDAVFDFHDALAGLEAVVGTPLRRAEGAGR